MLLKLGSRGVEVTNLQKDLKYLGYPLDVDGIFGKDTKAYVEMFQIDNGLYDDGIVGKNTLQKLEEELLSCTEEEYAVHNTPWVEAGLKDVGIHEVRDEEHVHQMWRDAKLSGLTKFPASEVPWCSAAICSWFERVGIRSARTDGAKNWLNWGVKLEKPAQGCVVVFTRKGGGHVGLVMGEDEKGNLLVLGGNHQNMVSIKSFSKARVVGYRYPKGYIEDYVLPVGNATELSNNEE